MSSSAIVGRLFQRERRQVDRSPFVHRDVCCRRHQLTLSHTRRHHQPHHHRGRRLHLLATTCLRRLVAPARPSPRPRWSAALPSWSVTESFLLGMNRIHIFEIWPEPDVTGYPLTYPAGTGTGYPVHPYSFCLQHRHRRNHHNSK